MGQQPARERECFIAVTGRGMRGRDGKKAHIRRMQQRKRRQTGKERREGGRGPSDAWPVGDAAQSVTHLDVLACVVAS